MDYGKIPEGVKGKRVAERLLDRKRELQEENGVPSKNENSLLLATWNIREFDSPSYGERNFEPLYYIAEIISHFDLVAVQEIREDLKALEQVRDLLGCWWKYIATDVTEGTRGNQERMAFFYDSRKVKFGNVAGEVVIPPVEIRKSGQKTEFFPSNQLYRTPSLCGFQASWSKFMLCTVHILFGENKADDPNRVEEIKQIATFLAKRSDEPTSWLENIILLGDFNIFDPKDVTMTQIMSVGFEVPPELQNLPQTNTGLKKRYYDQIAFMP